MKHPARGAHEFPDGPRRVPFSPDNPYIEARLRLVERDHGHAACAVRLREWAGDPDVVALAGGHEHHRALRIRRWLTADESSLVCPDNRVFVLAKRAGRQSSALAAIAVVVAASCSWWQPSWLYVSCSGADLSGPRGVHRRSDRQDQRVLLFPPRFDATRLVLVLGAFPPPTAAFLCFFRARCSPSNCCGGTLWLIADPYSRCASPLPTSLTVFLTRWRGDDCFFMSLPFSRQDEYREIRAAPSRATRANALRRGSHHLARPSVMLLSERPRV
jgi:hypothetical protein